METEAREAKGDKDKGRKNIRLEVSAPSEPDSKKMTFRGESLVGDAATEAAEKFGYATGGTPSFRLSDGTVLDRTVTLVAAGLKDDDEVEVVDAGGGV
jgi:hypothetical protein